MLALPLNMNEGSTININIKTDAFNSFSVKENSRESTDYKDFKQTFKLVRIESSRCFKIYKRRTYIEAEEKEFPLFHKGSINNLNVLK